jgi:hypothetical protein
MYLVPVKYLLNKEEILCLVYVEAKFTNNLNITAVYLRTEVPG